MSRADRPTVLVVAPSFQAFLVAGWEYRLPPSDEVRLFCVLVSDFPQVYEYHHSTPVVLVGPFPSRGPSYDEVYRRLASRFDAVEEVAL